MGFQFSAYSGLVFSTICIGSAFTDVHSGYYSEAVGSATSYQLVLHFAFGVRCYFGRLFGFHSVFPFRLWQLILLGAPQAW